MSLHGSTRARVLHWFVRGGVAKTSVGRTFPIDVDPVVVGRDDGVNISIEDPEVSARSTASSARPIRDPRARPREHQRDLHRLHAHPRGGHHDPGPKSPRGRPHHGRAKHEAARGCRVRGSLRAARRDIAEDAPRLRSSRRWPPRVACQHPPPWRAGPGRSSSPRRCTSRALARGDPSSRSTAGRIPPSLAEGPLRSRQGVALAWIRGPQGRPRGGARGDALPRRAGRAAGRSPAEAPASAVREAGQARRRDGVRADRRPRPWRRRGGTWGPRTPGASRSDLYFRIAQVRIELPPLRDRVADLPFLVEDICKRVDRAAQAPTVLAWVEQRLASHDWPGNVRELVNVVSVAATLADTPGAIDDVLTLARSRARRARTGDLAFGEAKRAAVAVFERDYFAGLAKRAKGNVSEMARQSGWSAITCGAYLRKYGVDRGVAVARARAMTGGLPLRHVGRGRRALPDRRAHERRGARTRPGARQLLQRAGELRAAHERARVHSRRRGGAARGDARRRRAALPALRRERPGWGTAISATSSPPAPSTRSSWGPAEPGARGMGTRFSTMLMALSAFGPLRSSRVYTSTSRSPKSFSVAPRRSASSWTPRRRSPPRPPRRRRCLRHLAPRLRTEDAEAQIRDPARVRSASTPVRKCVLPGIELAFWRAVRNGRARLAAYTR